MMAIEDKRLSTLLELDAPDSGVEGVLSTSAQTVVKGDYQWLCSARPGDTVTVSLGEDNSYTITVTVDGTQIWSYQPPEGEYTFPVPANAGSVIITVAA